MFYIFRFNNSRTQTIQSKDLYCDIAMNMIKENKGTLHGPFYNQNEADKALQKFNKKNRKNHVKSKEI